MILSKKDEIVYNKACDALKNDTFNSEEISKEACILIKKIGDSLKSGDLYFKVSTKERIENIGDILKAMEEKDLNCIKRIEEVPVMIGVGG